VELRSWLAWLLAKPIGRLVRDQVDSALLQLEADMERREKIERRIEKAGALHSLSHDDPHFHEGHTSDACVWCEDFDPPEISRRKEGPV